MFLLHPLSLRSDVLILAGKKTTLLTIDEAKISVRRENHDTLASHKLLDSDREDGFTWYPNDGRSRIELQTYSERISDQ